MDEGLRSAAQFGNIDVLYALIKDDADVLRRIDQMEFVDTPLHIAAASGHNDFAMEIMNLKPSFARKLNQDGFSPIHLALLNEQTEMVVDLLSVDKDLVRFKGREGYTPLHCVAKEGNVHLLSRFLDHCPDCILDLTIRKETALHIAAQSNNLRAFRAILMCIQKTPEDHQFQRKRILNMQDKNGNTVLHIAATNNQSQMIKLLMDCNEVDRNKINKAGLTALDILQRQNVLDCKESEKILNRARLRFSKLSEIKLNDYITEMAPDTINSLLVVFALVLTTTYQSVLSPPGGLSQGYGSDSNKDHVGKSVMDRYTFHSFYILNGVAFYMAWAITVALLRVVAKSIITFLYPLYILMVICYAIALGIIAPPTVASDVATGGSICLGVLICTACLFLFRK